MQMFRICFKTGKVSFHVLEVFDYALCDTSLCMLLFLLGLLFTVFGVKSSWNLLSFVISSSYSIQSRLKPGVTQGMLIYIYHYFLFILSHFFFVFSFFFCARFSSYPGPEICVRSSSELELRVSSCFSCYYIVFFCRLSSLALVVFVLVYLYFFCGSWAYINIWVPYLQVEVCSRSCAFSMQFSWLRLVFAFRFCWVL